MADLALIFGWPPATMAEMGLAELMDWRERAIRRHEPQE